MMARYPRISAPTFGFVFAALLVAPGCPEADPQPDGGAEVSQDTGSELGEVGPDADAITGLDGETLDEVDGSPDVDADTASEVQTEVDGDVNTPDGDVDNGPDDTDSPDEGIGDTDEVSDGEVSDGEVSDTDDAQDADTSDAEVEAEVDVWEGCTTDEQCAELNTNTCVTSACDHDSGECVDTPLADGIDCEDGNLCSTGETCAAGACIGGTAITCNDANPCTDDLCKPSQGCTFNFNFSQCDDGDACTVGDACLGGNCLPGGLKCDDDNPCTADNCDAAGECDFPPTDGVACDDGSDCTGGDTCNGGACVATIADACDDGNECTANSCSPDGKCVTQSLSGSACDDGDVCTTDDLCIGANCAPGATDPCDDGNDCTAAACDPVAGCTFEVTDGAACEDGDACTSGDLCNAAGTCLAGDAVECDDDNVCTADSCDPLLGCVNTNIDAACSDDDACTTNEMCVAGKCEVEAVECDDDDACTDDQCDTVLGCQYIDTSASCDDGDQCTDDSCDPTEGCVATANTAPCDDGDACTDSDACTDGVCAGTALDCDDDDACTLDVCTVEEGCVNAPFSGACDDGDACTEAEACEADGLCDGGTPVNIDDGVACTVDACDVNDGVTHVPDDGMCGTGFVCDVEADCEWGDVELVIERVMLDPTSEDDSVDGQGQWLVVRNVGALPADMANFVVTNDAGETAAITGPDGVGTVVLAPGAAMAMVKAPENLPGDVPTGAMGVFGTFGDGFGWLDTGDLVGIESTDGVLVETAPFENVVTTGEPQADQMPLIQGRFTDLDWAVAMDAAMGGDNTLNDDAANWCVGGSDVTALVTSCGRVVVNEVSLAGDNDNRWVELWAAPGANIDGLLVRLVSTDGAVVGLVLVPGGRMPLDSLRLLENGVGGAALAQLAQGSVQLLQNSVLIDVVGYGVISATADNQLGLPLFETAPATAPAVGESIARPAGGADTDDNSVDFTVGAGSPGVQNP